MVTGKKYIVSHNKSIYTIIYRLNEKQIGKAIYFGCSLDLSQCEKLLRLLVNTFSKGHHHVPYEGSLFFY